MKTLSSIIFISCLFFGCSMNKGTKIYLVFDNVQGLSAKAHVQTRGMKIGRITNMSLLGSDKILVELTIDPQANIPRGSVFTLANGDFLGTKEIRVDFSEAKDFYKTNDTVKGTNEKSLFDGLDLVSGVFSKGSSSSPCVKCDIAKVKTVHDSMDSLNFRIVEDFFCVFDASCKNNSEFSTWSNEMLFKVLYKQPALFLQVAAKGQVDNKILLHEIENPVQEPDLQKTYDKLKTAEGPEEIKTKYLSALVAAATKGGQQVKR